MKTSTYKYIVLLGLGGFFIACSTKKDSFVNRNYHALTTKDNVMFNGNMALEKGVNDLKTTYNDNFWETLPVERMQATEEEMGPEDRKNPDFERAEDKATKAIQKHSMYIGGTERNPQMDEAHLLLGKSRYYDNRFIPALEAFNYILYKYPTSDKINEAKVWREKTNIRLNFDGVAIKNLKELLEQPQLQENEQVYADANAMLAQAYMKTESPDSALSVLRKAAEFTKDNEQKARYRFITGQLYETLKQPDSAYTAFQKVIDMKRKAPRRYVIQAHARQAAQFDFKNDDTLAFMEKYNKLLKDRENRPYLDILNHQVALFYDKQNLDDNAIYYYNKSLRSQSQDKYMRASNHRNLAEIYFEEAKYVTAGKYYDSTMTYLQVRTREYNRIKKKRDNLSDVIKYEAIAQANDSILYVVSLSDNARTAYYEDYIARLKKEDELAAKKAEEEAQRMESMAGMVPSGAPNSALQSPMNTMQGKVAMRGTPASTIENGKRQSISPAIASPTGGTTANTATAGSGGGNFPFYIPAAASYGKLDFEKKWGRRPLVDNWRWAAELQNLKTAETEENGDVVAEGGEEGFNPRYSPEFYISQLPTEQKFLDSLATDRNFAYYQLGVIYKEKFREYERAADKLEKLLVNNPEERLILPAKYNLYKIYMEMDPAKAEKYKQQVLTEYPDSRYAELILNPTAEDQNNETPEAVYAALYKRFGNGEVRPLVQELEDRIDLYTGEAIVSKFELLKASVTARLEGIEGYRRTLNFVALNYPDSKEGKEAEAKLKKDIPALEKLAFGAPAITWKIIFKFEPNDSKIKPLKEKIQKFIKEGLNNSIVLTQDVYTMGDDFLVIHGFNSQLAAEDAVSVLKDYKEYKIAETPVIISSEDYKVVQIKKNYTEFLAIQ